MKPQIFLMENYPALSYQVIHRAKLSDTEGLVKWMTRDSTPPTDKNWEEDLQFLTNE